MFITLSQSQKNKVALVLLLMTVSIPLLLFNGTADAFIPKHIARIEEISCAGMVIEEENQVIQVPGFYVLGAVITLVSGLVPEKIIFFPIQLIPHAVLFFMVLYRVSGNSIVAGLITLIELCSGTTGTGKIFFWPHGIGNILFLSMLLLIFILLKRDRPSKMLIFLAVITGSSLVYISYNLTAMTLLLLVVIAALLTILYQISLMHNNTNSKHHSLSKIFLSLVLILSAVELGLSRFFYGVFIPTLRAAQDFEMSGLDKFLIAYVNPELSATSLSPIMVSYPAIISVISGIKYLFLVATILIFCTIVVKTIFKEKSLDHASLFILAILLMQGIYAIPRIMIGGIVVTYLWLPGILCVAQFSELSKRLRVWAFTVLFVILICTILYYFAMDSGDHIDRNEYQFSNYEIPVHWFFKVNDGNLAVSDELTNDFFILHSLKYSVAHGAPPDYDAIAKKHRIMPTEDARVLVQLSDGTLDTKYYILNQRLKGMSLQNWIIVKSWHYSSEMIDCNDQINKIYGVPLLSVYYS